MLTTLVLSGFALALVAPVVTRATRHAAGWVCALVLALLLAILTLPACGNSNPAGPATADMTGTWNGTSAYPNAPFRFEIVQSGRAVRGEYRDQLDTSLAVDGSVNGLTFQIVVDFGDAKLNVNGTVNGENAAEGVMFTSALGNRPFTFKMVR